MKGECALSIVEELGEKAFRRPLETNEKKQLVALYDDNISNEGFPPSIEMIVQAILANPKFLYLIEHGEEVGEGRFQLNDWEIATRLSYAIYEDSPDEELREAASRGDLRDKEKRGIQIRRLFEKPAAQKTIERFFEQWLWLDRLENLNKDNVIFPQFSDDLRAGMRMEETRFFRELFWVQNAELSELYTSSRVWPHPQSAQIYGFDDVQTQEQRNLPAERLGILTHPGLLAVTARLSDTSPVKRGVFVMEQILCQEPRPLPVGLEVTPPEPDLNLTTRERWAAHSSNPGCAGCHQDMDPIGFADGEIDGIVALSKRIASSPVVASCFAKQWLRFSLGRLDNEKEESIDVEAVNEMRAALESKSMKEAMIVLLQSTVVESELKTRNHREEKDIQNHTSNVFKRIWW